MKKFGNSMSISKGQGEWLIRASLMNLNSASAALYKLQARESLTEDAKSLQVLHIQRRAQAIEMLVILLDSNDRKVLVEALDHEPKKVPYEDDEKFKTWLTDAVKDRFITLEEYIPYQNLIRFTAVEI